MSSSKRPITAEDLYRIELITAAQISPDGAEIIYTIQRIDQKTEKKYSDLWLVATDGNTPARQITFGDYVDAAPNWSPDGNQIAFLSNRQDEKKSQIYILPRHGGEARPLTDFDGQIGEFSWSPDSTRLAVTYRQKDEETKAREADEEKKKLGVVSYHFNTLFFRSEGNGFRTEEQMQLWTVDVATGESKQLTNGPYPVRAPIWSPIVENETILFISNRNPNWEFDIDSDELYLIPAAGGELTKINAHAGGKMAATFSPDGNHIAYMGNRLRDGKFWQNTTLFVVSATNDGTAAEDISSHTDHDFGSSTLGDSGSPPPGMVPTWSYDGRYIYGTATRHGGNPLCRIEGESEELEKLIDDGTVIGMVSIDESNDTIAFFRATQTDPCQLWVYDTHTGEERQLTQLNQTLFEEIELGQIEEHWIKGKDGNDLHGWILFPPDFDASKSYPSILEIHGGPQTQYGRTFMHEFQYLAAQGYVVHFSNPRGGQGYGEAHGSAISGVWGTVDVADIMAWTDFVAGQSYIDTERMGITGGSYGGYLTGMTIGQTDRFKAAVPQRMVSNWISFYGTSDMTWMAQYLGGFDGQPWNNLEQYWGMSPISLISNVNTPTLVLHSLGDWRTPYEQGEQYYAMLKKQGVEAELVLLPDEGHGLSRGGRTDRRIVRLNSILGWFEKHLK